MAVRGSDAVLLPVFYPFAFPAFRTNDVLDPGAPLIFRVPAPTIVPARLKIDRTKRPRTDPSEDSSHVKAATRACEFFIARL